MYGIIKKEIVMLTIKQHKIMEEQCLETNFMMGDRYSHPRTYKEDDMDEKFRIIALIL